MRETRVENGNQLLGDRNIEVRDFFKGSDEGNEVVAMKMVRNVCVLGIF